MSLKECLLWESWECRGCSLLDWALLKITIINIPNNRRAYIGSHPSWQSSALKTQDGSRPSWQSSALKNAGWLAPLLAKLRFEKHRIGSAPSWQSSALKTQDWLAPSWQSSALKTIQIKNACKLGVFLFELFIRDLGRIQTCNLLSRNQMRYSVAPRGRFGCKYKNMPLITIKK